MRFIHLTDLHFSNPGNARYLSKRALGLFSWNNRRKLQHDIKILENLIENVIADKPEIVVITGDLVQLGTENEILLAKKWLSRVFEKVPLMIVPGNHDNYAIDSFSYIANHWSEFIHINPDFPSVKRFGDLVLIGLMSAKPMPFWSAQGDICAKQFDRLEGLLAQCEGKIVCLFLHHPPYLEGVKRRKSLKMSEKLRRLIIDKHVTLVCHGHLHRNIEFDGLMPTRVFCTASASACITDSCASYRVFDIDSHSQGFKIQTMLKQVDLKSNLVDVINTKAWNVGPCEVNSKSIVSG